MSDRAKLFHCHGTSYLFRWPGVPLAIDIAPKFITGDTFGPVIGNLNFQIPGINGSVFFWDGAVPNDPFPDMVDTTLYEPVRVAYPASFFPLGLSIDYGINAVAAKIKELTPGFPFSLVGYSQGAAVQAGVWSRLDGGDLAAWKPGFLGAVMFGNPRRMTNWRGPVGGTWSGQMGVANSNTGGHGSFPTTGYWPRMTNPPDTWVEFAAPGDVFTSVGDDAKGQGWVAANDVALDLTSSQILTYLTTGMAQSIADGFNYFFGEQGNLPNYLIDGANQLLVQTGNGHTVYPLLPPVNSDGTYNVTTVTSGGQTYKKAVGDTCYQVAIKYLNSLVGWGASVPAIVPAPNPRIAAWDTILMYQNLPAYSAGWTTTL